jgi:hypothetical protein
MSGGTRRSNADHPILCSGSSNPPCSSPPQIRPHRIRPSHATRFAPRRRQIKSICGSGRGLHQAIQPCLIDFAEVDRKERCANERLRKLFGGDGWAVDIGLWFTHAEEDNWCAPEPGGFENWQIDGSNRALRPGRSLSNVWFRPQERLNLSGGQQCQPRFRRP